MDFIIDTAGDEDLVEKQQLSDTENLGLFNKDDHKQNDLLSLMQSKCVELTKKFQRENEIEHKLSRLKFDDSINDFFKDMGWGENIGFNKFQKPRKTTFQFNHLDKNTGKLITKLGKVDVEKEMQTSVLQPGLEKEHSLPEYNKSARRARADRKKESEKTKGPGWFNMPAPELTEELKNDLNVLKMRSVMDPKHFYKKNDMEVLPKYFQMGRVMDSPLDHQSMRMTNKERKNTMVDELLADANFTRYNKRKFKEILDTKRKTDFKSVMREKRNKRKLFVSGEKKTKAAAKKKKKEEIV